MAEDREMVDKDIAKLWSELREFRAETEGRFREIMQLLVGHDGTNGLNSRIADAEEKIDSHDHQIAAGMDWGRRIVEVERHKPGWCIGKKELDIYKAQIDADTESRNRETAEMRKSRQAMTGAIIVALLATAGNIAVAFISKGGQ